MMLLLLLVFVVAVVVFDDDVAIVVVIVNVDVVMRGNQLPASGARWQHVFQICLATFIK